MQSIFDAANMQSDGPDTTTPERLLWQAVLVQAISDYANIRTGTKGSACDTISAHAFLFDDRLLPYLAGVCDAVGTSVGHVRRAARYAAEHQSEFVKNVSREIAADVIRLRTGGMRIKDIADRLKLTRSTVSYWASHTKP